MSVLQVVVERKPRAASCASICAAWVLCTAPAHAAPRTDVVTLVNVVTSLGYSV